MPELLVVSLVLSVVLTVLLNVVLRLFPGAGDRIGDAVERAAERARQPDDGRPGVRVVFPWKWMLVMSLALTVVVNLLLALWR